MKTRYYGHSKNSGVYRIVNLNNRKIYVGSAKRFKERYAGHIRSLRNNKHQNKHLQASFNKHGEDAFLFEVVEVVDGNKNERYKEEQKYIDKLVSEDRWKDTFNFKKETVQKERSSFSKNPKGTKKKLSKAQKRLWEDPEERKKRIEGGDGKRRHRIRKAAKRVWESMSNQEKQEHLEKSLYTNRGWKKGSKHTKEARDKMSKICKERFADPEKRKRLIRQGQNAAKTYLMIDPFGNKVTIHNMTKFCRENNLTKQRMLSVANGFAGQHKGWTKQ